MTYFLSCDWGTSAFRLRLVAVTGLKVVAEEVSEHGIANTFQQWRESGQADRTEFYLGIVAEHIQKLEKKLNQALDQVPVVVSGMASSSIGMQELPYHELPFALDGSALKIKMLKAQPGFNQDVLLISGVRSTHDVMRGEETQLIGLINQEQITAGQEHIFIFPGTHSKHIRIKEHKAVGFKTYMTGEIFALLAQKSILSTTVAPADDLEDPTLRDAFSQGVKEAVGANLLHAAFRARTNNLFGVLNLKENFNYLSGLVIGTELLDLRFSDTRISLVAGGKLQKYYATALQALGLSEQVETFPPQWVDEAVVRGQFKIYQRLINQL